MQRDMQAQETGEAYLILLTIAHSSLESPLRFTSDGVKTESQGHTFISFPFEFIAPEDTENGSTRAQIRFDNVDRSIVETIRTIDSPPKITAQVVRGSDPEEIEVEWPNFDLLSVEYDALVVSGEIGLESYVLEPFPKDLFTPSTAPALF